MSIKEMIREHPQVGSDYNESLAEAVKHAMYCAAICNSCADACSAEEMDMARCIRLCLDCSDVCTATYRVATRRTDENRQLIRSVLAVCIEACETCAEECAKHDTDHCRRCERMCRECAEDCRTALAGVNDEVHADGERSTFAHGAD
ncbi:MAG: four-helix bundle copper-binding protein [Tsuneonella sp.]